MKKVLLGLALCSILGLGVTCGGIKANNIKAEGSEPITSEVTSSEPVTSETPSEPEPSTKEYRTLTFKCPEGTVTIVLKENNVCEVTMTPIEGEPKVGNLQYEIIDNTHIKIFVKDANEYFILTVDVNDNVINAEPVENYPCTVVIENVVGGKITTDIKKGKVGDIVTITSDPDTFYLLSSVTVNGTPLVANEHGVYTFVLVEGQNLIVPTFEVDEKLLHQFSDIYANIKAHNWSEVFNVANILMILNWILNGAIGIGLVKVLSKYKKFKAINTDIIEEKTNAVVNNVKEVVPDTVAGIIDNLLVTVLKPLLEKMENVEESNKTFAKCLALAQENTPESRTAIINSLAELNISDDKVMKEVKDFIEKEKDEIKKFYDEQVEAIKIARENNQKVLESTNVEEEHLKEIAISDPNKNEEVVNVEDIRPLE